MTKYKYKYNEIRTKVKCINDDCYWNSKHEYCIKDTITVNIDCACEDYNPEPLEEVCLDDQT